MLGEWLIAGDDIERQAAATQRVLHTHQFVPQLGAASAAEGGNVIAVCDCGVVAIGVLEDGRFMGWIDVVGGQR